MSQTQMNQASTKLTPWHLVKPEDSVRIPCSDCGAPAYACEHMHWETAGKAGVSFFYYCHPCAVKRSGNGLLADCMEVGHMTGQANQTMPDAEDYIQTVEGKREFLRNYLNSVRDELVAKATDMPEEWNGFELRWLVADKFAWESKSKRQLPGRKRAYNHAKLVRNL